MFLQVSHTFSLFLIFFTFKETSALEWRIFGGQDIRYDVHKYLVKLRFCRHKERSYGICSGSIISSTWILTSAHCNLPDLDKVIALHKTKENMKAIAVVNNSDIYSHPDFTPGVTTGRNSENDIALLHIREPIKFNSFINIIKLAKRDVKVGETGIMAGYGDSESRYLTPKEGAVVVSRCPYYKAKAICTVGSVRAGSGDSGGPLIYRGRLVGVTSASCHDDRINRMCLTVFTSVAANINWIREVLKK